MDEASVLQANKDHFNHAAQTGSYDEHPFVVKVSREIAEAIRNQYPFDKHTTTLLDYACGTGQMSRHLAPHTRQIVGIDLSQGMVDFYNQWGHNQGIPSDQMRAIILEDEERELSDQKFDVIVCVQAYHHFSDIHSVTRKLASLLKPSGKLFVADLMKHDVNVLRSFGSTHGHMHKHHGHGHGHGLGHTHGHGSSEASASRHPQDPQPFSHHQPGGHHGRHGELHAHSHTHSHPYDVPESHKDTTSTDDTKPNNTDINPKPDANKDEYNNTNQHEKGNADGNGGENALFQGPTVVRKGGFEEDDIRMVFDAAGLVDWQFIQGAASVESDEKRVELFLAVGRHP